MRPALAAGCVLLAAACGSTAAPGTGTAGANPAGSTTAGSSTGSSGDTAASSVAKVSLDVSFTGSPTTPAHNYTLTCGPTGGTAPDPAASCAKLMRSPSLFGPLPKHVMCPMIMANAGRVIVTGRYDGTYVHETLVDGGCTIARFNSFRQIFN